MWREQLRREHGDFELELLELSMHPLEHFTSSCEKVCMLFDVDEGDLSSADMRCDPRRGVWDRDGAFVTLGAALTVRGERLAWQPSRNVHVLFTWLREVDFKRACPNLSLRKGMLQNSLLDD